MRYVRCNNETDSNNVYRSDHLDIFICINIGNKMSMMEIDLIITKMTKSIEIIMSRQK